MSKLTNVLAGFNPDTARERLLKLLQQFVNLTVRKTYKIDVTDIGVRPGAIDCLFDVYVVNNKNEKEKYKEYRLDTNESYIIEFELFDIEKTCSQQEMGDVEFNFPEFEGYICNKKSWSAEAKKLCDQIMVLAFKATLYKKLLSNALDYSDYCIVANVYKGGTEDYVLQLIPGDVTSWHSRNGSNINTHIFCAKV